MTPEEKAKAYDKIVNKLRCFLMQGVNPLITRADVQDFFPELKEELENEKIRNEIISALKFANVKGVYDKHIAYLEKQGEQKPTEDIETLMSLDEAIEHCKEKSCGNNACALEHKQLEEWLIELKELKDQKPKKPIWDEEDERIYNRIYNLIHDAAYANYDVDEDGKVLGTYTKLVNWFKELKARVQPQPKQEWNEKDKYILHNIFDFVAENLVDKNKRACANECLIWIKDLKERVQPQPKQEWSKDDDQYLLVCKNALKKYQITDKWDAQIISQWLEDKLKSLRP